MLKKYSALEWIGFIWLGLGTSIGFLWTR